MQAQSNKVVQFRKPLPGEAKQYQEEMESARSNLIIESLSSNLSISSFFLDSTLWIFSNALLGQALHWLSSIFPLALILRYVAIVIIFLGLSSAYLIWSFPELKKAFTYRASLIVLGIILGII